MTMILTQEQQQALTYIYAQQANTFTGANDLTGFRRQISDALIATESGSYNVAYRLSHAVQGLSSFSFGAAQWDVGIFGPMNPPGSPTNLVVDSPRYASPNSWGMRMLEQVLSNALDANGSRIVSDAQIKQIIEEKLGITGALARNNPAALGTVVVNADGSQSIPLIDLVNRALNSTYGQQQIDAWHQQHMADLEAHSNYIVNSVTDPDRRAFLQGSLTARLFFADMMNQFGPKYGRNFMVPYLNSTISSPISPAKLAVSGSALGYDDILNYYFSVPAKIGVPDRIRRFDHVLTYANK